MEMISLLIIFMENNFFMKKILFFLLVTLTANAQENVTTGPENGSLVIVGGGRVGEAITKKFIELAGGADAKIVVIPTASGGEIDIQKVWFANQLKEYGAADVTVLHTYEKRRPIPRRLLHLLKMPRPFGSVAVGNGAWWMPMLAPKPKNKYGPF